MSIPTRNAVIEQMHQSLQRLRGRRVAVDQFTEEARLSEELSLDSLDLLEIRFDIEEKWRVELEDKEAAALVTVKDVIDLIQTKVSKNLDEKP